MARGGVVARGGRLLREREELQGLLEELNFEFVELDDYVGHLATIESEAAGQVAAATHRLEQAEKRLERIHGSTAEVRRLLPSSDAEATILGHLEAVELETQGDVIAARRHLEATQRRHERIREHIGQLRGHINHDRLAVLELTAKSGWGHQIRPEVRAAANGALAALSARRGNE